MRSPPPQDDSVKQVIICTHDKDLSQCVVGTRVVQLDRRRDILRDEAGVVAKFGVSPQIDSGLPGPSRRHCRWLPRSVRMGRKSCGPHFISVPAPRRHSEGVESVASVDTEGPATVRITVQCLERRPVVSHARDLAAGCSRL
jgi:hypothetical protein